MKNILIVLLALSISSAVHANILEDQQAPETSYIRPGPRPAPYPGPRPHPRPNPQPYPPGGGARYEYVTCQSWDYRYQECYIGAYGVHTIRIFQVDSHEPCLYNQTFGIYNDRVWVNRGCRATFEIVRTY